MIYFSNFVWICLCYVVLNIGYLDVMVWFFVYVCMVCVGIFIFVGMELWGKYDV